MNDDWTTLGNESTIGGSGALGIQTTNFLWKILQIYKWEYYWRREVVIKSESVTASTFQYQVPGVKGNVWSKESEADPTIIL